MESVDQDLTTCLKANVLAGFSLYVRNKEAEFWPKNWFGLVEHGVPLFVFEGPLLRDPTSGLTEDDLTVMPEYPDGYDEYESAAIRLGHAMRLAPDVGYRLVRACMARGYNPRVSGSLSFWLLNFLAEQLESNS